MARKEHPQGKGMKNKNSKPRAANKVSIFSARVRSVRCKVSETAKDGESIKRPLTWKNTKRGTSGTFVALYEEMIDDLPPGLSAPPEDRIAMFEKIRTALNTKPQNNIADTGAIVYAIPWTMLDFPRDGVGREKHVNRGHVGHIVQNYHSGSWSPPTVTMRPIYNAAGELETVLFEVTDGYHRRCVILERAYASRPDDLRTGKQPIKINVSISEIASVREAAKSFEDQNAAKLIVTGSDNWRNMYIAGKPEVVSTVRLAAEYGLDASAPVDKRGWPRCQGKIIMHMCNIDFGGGPYHFPWITEKDVRTALRIVNDPECVGVYRNSDAINKQNFFAGLCHFIAFYVRPGYVHDSGLKHLLSRPDIVERAIEVGKDLSPSVIQVEMPQVTSAMLARDEARRYHQVAAALRQFYVTKVPPPKMRSKNDGWPECPAELRQLFHVAPDITDDAKRAAFIVDLHTKLDNARGKKRRGSSPKSITR